MATCWSATGIVRHTCEEAVHEGMRLGRHPVLDARSLAYAIERDALAMAAPIREVE